MASAIKNQLSQVEWKNAIKTGIAATLSIMAGNLLDRLIGHPENMISILWCTLTAIVVLQARLGGTYKEALKQLIGIAIGSTIGSFFAATFPAPPTAFTIGTSVTLTIILCTLSHVQDSVRIAAISVAIVLIVWGMRPESSPWMFGFYRFLNSATGVIVAVLVAHLVWPSHATQKMRLNMAQMLATLKTLFGDLNNFSLDHEARTERSNETADQFVDQLDGAQIFLDETRMELMARVPVALYEMMIHRLETLFDNMMVLRKLDERRLKPMQDTSLENATKELVHEINLYFEQLKAHLETSTPIKNPQPMELALEKVNAERLRFRRDQILRNYSLSDVESFFVYFHSLKITVEQLTRFNAALKEANFQ